MKLLVKFNLLYVVTMAVGVGSCALIARDLLRDDARAVVVDNARQMMDQANAVRRYTTTQIAPLLDTQTAHAFLPQSVPSYSATEVLSMLSSRNAGYFYKEATLNPTNLRDRATGWEVDVVDRFRSGAKLSEVVGERETPAGRSLYVARPMQITDGACLQCHSSVDAAPAPMLAKYGTANGFGWQMNEVIGAQIVSVPLEVALNRADQSLGVFVGSLAAVLVAAGALLNLLIWWVVVRPIQRLSDLSDRVSQGDLQAPEFERGGNDEIGVLAEAFSRMRASVTQAMKMLDA